MKEIIETEKEMEFGTKLYEGISAPAPTNPLEAILAQPERLNELNTENLQALYEMNTREMERQGKVSFNNAFADVQAELKRVPKNGRNEYSGIKYVLLHDLTAMLDPILSKHGFSRSLSTEGSDLEGHVRYVLTIRHRLGHSEQHRADLPIDDAGSGGKKNKSRIQALGSTFTYAERYLLTKVWGVESGDVDDDGAGGAQSKPAATLSIEQQAAVSAHLDRSGRAESKFLAVYGVESIADIPAACFNGAMHTLKQAIALQEKKNAPTSTAE